MSQFVEKFERIEKIFTVIWMLSIAGSFLLYPPQEISHEPFGGRISIALVNAFNNLVFLGIFLRHWKRIFYVAFQNFPLLLLLGLVAFSIFWSVDIPSTASQGRGILRVSLMGIYLACRYDFKTQMNLFARVFGVTALLNLAACLLLPHYGYGVHINYNGAWCGIYEHKNELGYLMALGGFIFLLRALDSTKYRLINLIFFIICSILVVRSASTSAIFNLLSIFILLPIYKLCQRRSSYKLQVVLVNFATIIALSVVIFLKNSAEILTGYAGKDMTLTGRAELWEELRYLIDQKPFLGYGYLSFWRSDVGLLVKSHYPWAGDAHNGFIQLLLDLGYLGLILFLIGFLQFFLNSLRKLLFDSKSTLNFFPMQFLVYLIILNTSEARLLLPTWNWFVYTAIFFALILERRKRLRKFQSVEQ